MSRKNINVTRLREMKASGDKITCLTAYDASFASVLDAAGVDLILVGDSLGMVVQGQSSTLPVSLEEMAYHARCVRRGAPASMVIVDMPFMSNATTEQAVNNAGYLIKESGAQVVKFEGASDFTLEAIRRLTELGVPVCGHLGLLPQSVNKLGGYRVQGKDQEQADLILDQAVMLEKAGAELLVLECVPAELAAKITQTISIPTIGIGAGKQCDGQVLVLYDMLAVSFGKRPRFSKDFMQQAGSVPAAVSAFVAEVKSGVFPSDEHSF